METGKVLIIDDDELSYFSMSLAARSEFFEILPQAENSIKALEAIEKFNPSIILMDVRLDTNLTGAKNEFKDGIELAHFINSRYKIPIIFITGFSDFETVSRSISKDFYGILPKPVDKITLQTALLSTLLRFRQDQEKSQQNDMVNMFFDHSMFGYFLAESPTIKGEDIKKNQNQILKQTVFTKVNTVLLEMFNFKEADVIGKSITSLFNVESESLTQLLHALISKRSYEGRLKLIDSKGKPFTAEVFCKRVRFTQTNQQVILGMIRDISEQIKAQSQLELLATAIGEIKEAVIVTTPFFEEPNPRIIYVNDAACKMTGYSREELIGKTPRILQGPKTNRDVLEQLKNSIKVGDSFSARNVNYRKDGTMYHVEWNIVPVKNESESIEYFVSVQRDITDEVHMLEQLKQNQELLQAILNNSRVGKLLISAKNEILFVNEYAQSIFKDDVTNPLTVGSNLLETFPKDISESIQKALRSAEYTKVVSNEIQLHVNGVTRVYEYSCKKIGNNSNTNEVQYLITTFDITEIKRSNFELQEMNKKLEDMVDERTLEYKLAKEEAIELARVKERFLANMSHEIRTPINGIRGMVHLLQDTLLNKIQLEYVETIRTSSDSLLVIINDILDIEKIEAGKIELEAMPFDVVDIAVNTQRILGDKASKKGIKLFTQTENLNSKLVKGDRARIQQVVLNLTDNAIKFTSNGSVTVAFTSHLNQFNKTELAIFVTDSGIGMGPEQLGKIFNPFEQADASISRRFGGTGLGLSISKKLIELMGGEILVESEKGKGSTFKAFLPVEVWDGEIQKVNRITIDDVDFCGVHVLLVDDNKVNLLFLRRLLERWSCEVDIIESGIEALDLVRNKKYDLIFMDIQMPEMDGYEVSRFIRNEMKLSSKNLPIVAITADVLTDQSQSMENAGINDMVTKPFDPIDIKQMIQKWVFSTNEQALNHQEEKKNMTQFKLIDLAQVDDMAGGDEEFKQNILTQFNHVLTDSIIEIPEAIQKKDTKQIRNLIHRIKPNAGYFGLKKIAGMCKDIMQLIDENPAELNHIFDLAHEITTQLSQAADEVKQVLKLQSEA